MYLSRRSQDHLLWGLLTGSCVHTTISSRATQTRASSINVYSDPSDAHEGPILDIWMPEGSDRWVTAGADGRVKYWLLDRAAASSRGQTPNSISCLFSSTPAVTPMDRSDEVKRRQVVRPDPIIIARCNVAHNVICGVTEEGDLRVWHEDEFRVDVGSGVNRMELSVQQSSAGLTISVLIHHKLSPTFARYDITGKVVKTIVFTGADPLSCIHADLSTTPQISSSPSTETFGQLVITGDIHGVMSIWSWTGVLLRRWQAMSGSITAVDMSCGLVAIGR